MPRGEYREWLVPEWRGVEMVVNKISLTIWVSFHGGCRDDEIEGFHEGREKAVFSP